ncbi:MAG: 2Fe-2S iron-sulfur cluster binding domain-containing protein [Hyphomicrobiaceae bacterium]
MKRLHQVTINDASFSAQRGELLLDAALRNGVSLPYDCRSGHCGTCCVRVISGEVLGGTGSEPGVVHACQCRIVSDIVIAKGQSTGLRSVQGVVSRLIPLSPDVVEVRIKTEQSLYYHPGQYAQVEFSGYPSRPFSITHALRGTLGSQVMTFHIRRMQGGHVTAVLGKRIKSGHRIRLTGPFGTAHFRPNLSGRHILVATHTGFAPIWSIAIAALRENPERSMVVIVGGRTLNALYMSPALGQLGRFPNVDVVPVCSTPQRVSGSVRLGRVTDFLPRLHASDVIYACGAAPMVGSVQAIAEQAGAVCYADPFVPTKGNATRSTGLSRAMGRLSDVTLSRSGEGEVHHAQRHRCDRLMPSYDMREDDMRGRFRLRSA